MAAETIIDIKASMEYDNDHVVHNNLFYALAFYQTALVWSLSQPFLSASAKFCFT